MPKRTAAGRPARKETKAVKLKVDHLAGLASAIAGPDKQVEVLRLSDDRVLGHISRYISTRSIAIDKITRNNGFPASRVVEVYGLNGSGKTTLILQLCAQVQSLGGAVAFLDSENNLDRHYAKALGVDADKFLMIQPPNKTMEAAIASTEAALSYWVEQGLSEVPLVVVWDSAANLATEQEIKNPGAAAGEGDDEEEEGKKKKKKLQPGVAAKLLRGALRVLTEKVARAGALWLITNQLYDKIGAFGHGPGPKRSTNLGEGLRYQATLRVEMIRVGMLEDTKENAVGIKVLVKLMKNHAGSMEGSDEEQALEMPEDTVAIQRGHGFSNAWSVFQRLKEHRYITVGGRGVYTFSVKGQASTTWTGGWMGLQDLLAKDPALLKEMFTMFMALK